MKNKKGFTLVEILLVIVLIAIVTAVVLPNIADSIDVSKQKKYESYVTLLENNLEMYNTDNFEDLWTGEEPIGTTNDTITYNNLLSRTSEIDIEDCEVESLTIKKESNSKYSYKACITCSTKFSNCK